MYIHTYLGQGLNQGCTRTSVLVKFGVLNLSGPGTMFGFAALQVGASNGG